MFTYFLHKVELDKPKTLSFGDARLSIDRSKIILKEVARDLQVIACRGQSLVAKSENPLECQRLKSQTLRGAPHS